MSSGQIIIACGGQAEHGIYVSTDAGLNWFEKSNNLQGITFTQLLIKDNVVYAGTSYESVWKRSLSELIGIRNISEEIPLSFKLLQNYPNPFNPVTKIKFSVPVKSSVKLEIIDITGKIVQTIHDGIVQEGTYEAIWDGKSMPSGIYFCRMYNEKTTQTIKLMLLK